VRIDENAQIPASPLTLCRAPRAAAAVERCPRVILAPLHVLACTRDHRSAIFGTLACTSKARRVSAGDVEREGEFMVCGTRLTRSACVCAGSGISETPKLRRHLLQGGASGDGASDETGTNSKVSALEYVSLHIVSVYSF